MYTINSVSPVKKDIKKLPPQVVELIQDHYFPILRVDPFQADSLSGEFSGLKSYHFKFKGVDYRIIYQVWEKEEIIRILMIGKRENIYKKLKLRIH